jgi:hypothetical protein
MDDRGLKYDVFLSHKRAPTFSQRITVSERARYVQLPSDLPERIRTLAERWTVDAATPADKAKAIEQHLRTEYRYDLASPSGRDRQPLEHFLFESKRGHCEFYSTAMAIMLRTVDVPTRNVTGFIGGTFNRFGHFYTVRQGDAHSWVEAYLEDAGGWITYDPTPPSDAAPKSELSGAWAYLRDLLEATSQRWDHHVVGYDLNQQVGLFQSLSSKYRKTSERFGGTARTRVFAYGATSLFIAGITAWYFYRRRSRRRVESNGTPGARSPHAMVATALYETLEAAMTFHGIGRAASTPPLRHASALSAIDHPLAGEIVALTETYLGARFGGVPITEEDRKDYEHRVKALRAAEMRKAKGTPAPDGISR